MITNGFSREKLQRLIREREVAAAELIFFDDPVGRIYQMEGEYIVVLGHPNEAPHEVRRFPTFGGAFGYLDSLEAC